MASNKKGNRKAEQQPTLNNDNKHLFNREIIEKFEEVVYTMNKRFQLLNKKEALSEEIDKKMEKNANAAPQKIVLDIGGQKFACSKTTLLSAEDSFFSAMLSSGTWKPDADGTYFIDRDPELFPVILNYLRKRKLEKYNYDVTELLQDELDFYQITIPEFCAKVEVRSLVTYTMFSGSKILPSFHQQLLAEWLCGPEGTLLYCATRDGFDAPAFHNKCDNQGPTLTIIRARELIFGGYTRTNWDSSNTIVQSVDGWIFHLQSFLGPRNFLPHCSETAQQPGLYCYAKYGPTFGNKNGFDIHVSENSHCMKGSTTGISGAYETNRAWHELRFLSSEIEVYLIQ